MDLEESTSGADAVAEISPDGEIILVVGPQAVQLKVNSLFLRSASKVFGAMLGPNWSEGQALSKESPREIL